MAQQVKYTPEPSTRSKTRFGIPRGDLSRPCRSTILPFTVNRNGGVNLLRSARKTVTQQSGGGTTNGIFRRLSAVGRSNILIVVPPSLMVYLCISSLLRFQLTTLLLSYDPKKHASAHTHTHTQTRIHTQTHEHEEYCLDDKLLRLYELKPRPSTCASMPVHTYTHTYAHPHTPRRMNTQSIAWMIHFSAFCTAAFSLRRCGTATRRHTPAFA